MQRHTCQHNCLRRRRDAVNGGSMDEDRADISYIHANGYRPCAYPRPRLAEADQLFARQVFQCNIAEVAPQLLKGLTLAPPRRLANFVDMRINQGCESRLFTDARRFGAFAGDDGGLGFAGPGLGFRFEAEAFRNVLPTTTSLGTPQSGRQLVEGRHATVSAPNTLCTNRAHGHCEKLRNDAKICAQLAVRSRSNPLSLLEKSWNIKGIDFLLHL